MELTSKFWRKYFKVYDALNELIPYQDLLNKFVALGEVKNDTKVLDLGSGTGNLAIKLEELGAKVTGIDSSDEAIQRHRIKSHKTEIIMGDITKKLPLEDNYFDLVCSNNVIYTIRENRRDDLFRELYRVTKPGGIIIISNLNRGFSPSEIYRDHIRSYYQQNGMIQTFWSILKFIYPTVLIFWYNNKIKRANTGGQYQFLDAGEQESLLEKAGFSISYKSISVYSGQAFLVKGYKK